MTEKRVQFSNIVKNQLPSYVRDEFPLISEFLSQYYISQEFKGAPVDLIQNIDQYVKLDEVANRTDSLYLLNDIDDLSATITIDIEKNPEGTVNFPDSYGLIQIDNEIITYTSKTFNSFVGCIRGFSGITSYNTPNKPDELTFESTESSSHSLGSIIINLSSLFLKQFLSKIKYQLSPGFEDRDIYPNVNESILLKQIKDFYQSKGTDESFKILFKILYGKDVKIIRPKENLFRPSDARYRASNDLVVESILGNPLNLLNQTLYQDQYQDIISYARSPITYIEKIVSRSGNTYYKISLDSDYNRDIITNGATIGKFTVHPQTKIIGSVSPNSTVLDVDSTVGFPSTGELQVTYNDQTTGVISYTSKSLTQFFGCSGISATIDDGSPVSINTYAFAEDPTDGSLVKLRVTSVLNSVEIDGSTRYYYKNDTSVIRTLGTNIKDVTSKNWFFNLPISYTVLSVRSLGTEDTYQITTRNENILKIGDNIDIIASGFKKTTTVIDIDSDTSFKVKGQGLIPNNQNYIVKKKLFKVNSSYFSTSGVGLNDISTINSNVQNVYNIKDELLISSPSIPTYYNQSLNATDRSIVFFGSFSGEVFTITTNKDHGFYTGDCIYYLPSSPQNSLFEEGIYFIKRIDGFRISLAKSRTNIFNNIFVSIQEEKIITSENSSKLILFDFYLKSLNNQKLLRKISLPTNDGKIYKTNPGFTGILINGVEICNYKSSETIYYGKIEGIDVISPGLNYDVINPPILSIEDFDKNGNILGSGANGFCAVNGSLQEIRIIDPGFDYLDTPIIKITGGNGTGARAFANMKSIVHAPSFNSQANSNLVKIGSNFSTIGFTTYHKFRNAERVIYKTDEQINIGGLISDSSYFVSVQDNYTVKLHNTFNDAVSGINTVILSSYGVGNHRLQSYNQKLVIGSINVEDSGTGYENKKRTTTHLGINTSLSQININSHGYNSGETIVYTSESTSISGLTTNTNYIVTKIDDDSFKLSRVGVGSDNYDFFYKTKQYVNLNSVGLGGTHVFNYPEIKVEVIGRVGILPIGTQTFDAIVQPIFRGEITSVHLSSNGVGYGSSEIINFNRQPEFNLKTGKFAQLTPIVSSDGRIVEVLVNSSGSEYNSPPTLVINGTGIGAVLTPLISNDGKIISVNVIEGGIGYTQGSTSIDVISSGSSANFRAKIQSWNINLYKKYYSSITNDDGFITKGTNENYGLQYSHLYAPRKLREIIQPLDQIGNKVYGKTDLIKENDQEINSTYHSPIIGWAYDGNPIYGPYGYSTKTGGTVVQLKSGYEIKKNLSGDHNRPTISIFEEGFFVEDFIYYEKNDDTVLDENNGRFCITPEFPNGTYAYFATFKETVNNDIKFSNYKEPVFPYIIGNNYKSKPIDFNFSPESNQDQLDLNNTKWFRNTHFYNLIDGESSYSYITTPNDLNQTIDVSFASPGFVEKINVVNGGSNYQVDDLVLFDDTDTMGSGASARISEIEGKEINFVSVGTSIISNSEIYPGKNKGEYIIFTENPHNFKNNDVISVSGLNTTFTSIEGAYNAGVSTNILILSGIGTTAGTVTIGIASTGITGIITYINVSGNLEYPNIRENDVLSIENEKLKVLNVDKRNSRIRVIRSYLGTVGLSHTASTKIFENSRKLLINSTFKYPYNYRINTQLYFNPIDSVGLGTISGVGIGTTIVFSNPGSGSTQIFIPTKSIYIPNHGLETGDLVTYSNNSGSSLVVSITGIGTTTIGDQSNFYVAKISDNLIGISTVKVGLGSTGTFVGIASTQRSSSTLYFVGLGSGVYHSFKTNFNVITGKIERNLVTVSCAETHGLINNDTVVMNVNPSISTTFTLKYNDFRRKFVVNSRSFDSVGVNTFANSINIENHGFVTGQKVIHTSTLPSVGLDNNGEYFVIVVDKNNIKLANTFYDATKLNPNQVRITSSSYGNIEPINPQLTLYKDSQISFDLSDPSLSYINESQRYSAFSLDFYKDSDFKQSFESSGKQNSFEIKRIGIVGITSNAKVILSVNNNIPEILYYKLTPIYENLIPQEKENVSIDSEVLFNNQLQIKESEYNGKKVITSTSSTTFTYTLPKTPETSSYNSSSAKINYTTDSITAFGPISKVELTSKGRNYYSLPGISTVVSNNGFGYILESSSFSIGQIKKNKINDIGFDFPSDFTLRPTISLNQIIKVEPLSSLRSVGVSSFGRGYTIAPKLLVFDGKTNKLIPEIDLKYTLGKSNVEILRNAYSLNNVTPKILPTQNSNGVGIGSISYNLTTKDVTVGLSVGFSTAESFPFKVNDKIMIENVSVGIGSTGIGYNSENYNYQLFTITSVNENRGGLGSITYSLKDFLLDSQTPGTYDKVNSSGRIIPEKYFPIFNVELQKNNYLIGELVKSKSINGYVDGWNPITNQLRVVSKDKFISEEIIEGVVSNTQGIINTVDTQDASFILDSSSLVDNGWKSTSGFLNTDSERIQDSDFYQNFSYSIKSSVSYDTWSDAVGALNHTTGFKKFAEYQLETTNSNTLFDPQSSRSYTNVVFDIVGFGNLNCVYDFDLVNENLLISNGKSFSNEIIFSSRILSDYFESVGNRVLSIDDLSSEFNSNPRSTRFSEVHRFLLSDARAQKYITYVSDRRFLGQRQLMIVSLLHDLGIGYINQYARLETVYDMGSFDFFIEGSEGVLTFNPTKYTVNDYNITTLSYNLRDSMLGIGTTNFGDLVTIKTGSGFVSSGSTTIVSVGSSYNSAKILVEINASTGEHEFDELNLVHDGTNVELLEYGQIIDYSSDSYSNSGLGTYNSYISGSTLNVDFYPKSGIAVTFNTFQTLLGGSSTGIGTYDMKHARLQGISTSISSSASPNAVTIVEYPDDYDCSYSVIHVSDTTNNRHQLCELVVLDDQTIENSGEVYLVEFGNVETYSGLGTFGARKNGTVTEITFTPLPDISTRVNSFFNALRHQDDTKDVISFNNGSIETNYGSYFGTENDIKRAFDLKHEGVKIFKREFDGSNSSTVNTVLDTITIPNHFFVTGEQVKYTHAGAGSTQAIGIAATDFGVGIGTTDKLPSNVYVIKLNNNTIRLSRSAEDALSLTPKFLDITSVGIGSSHTFISKNQNSKVIVSIDNLIQSPLVSTAQTTTLSINAFSTDDIIYFSGITSFFGGDLIEIGSEIMKIDSIGIGSTNAVRVRRPWMGTVVAGHSTGSLVTKVIGNYNIVDNTINFAEAPYGSVPISSSTGDPDERDWSGISTSSSFQGRTFLRSGIPAGTNETYSKNYVFNDISNQFNGKNKNFTLKSNGSDVSGISNENSIILINDIFQGPGLTNDYYLSESSGITSITFTGLGVSVAYDVNTASLPSGGVIVSVGSTEGFGYQALVSAGGTAIVSGLGTISSISIGNSGSGYRSGLQTVRVGVATSSTGIPKIEFIGTALVSNGRVVSVAITNPGSGYTSSNSPYVVFDSPLSYTNLPLIYSSSSPSGIGTQATVDIVVGQGSSVIDFEIKNLGYGYGQGEILTVATGGFTGIPTDLSKPFREFQISIQKTISDKFTGWFIGELQVLDTIQSLFDDSRLTFPLTVSGSSISIISSRGSNINIQDNLLIFLNDVLQEPGKGYVFKGGSTITFTEPPKSGDTCKIIFYKGSGSVDVIERSVLETVKKGDQLTIGYDSTLGQSKFLQQSERTVESTDSTDLVKSLPYYGPGLENNPNVLRPITWCRQTEDLIINEKEVGKNRELYEPIINPFAYIIQSVGIGSTVIYVDSVRPFFNAQNENNVSLSFQNKVTLIPQEPKSGAAATSIVSGLGTISSVIITDGGVGYTTATVSFASTIGVSTSSQAFGTVIIGVGGSVVGISITNPGVGYTSSNPPSVLISSPIFSYESNDVSLYEGDFGIISGISTTSIGIASTAIVFDFVIPNNSILRNSSSLTGLTTISGIQTGYYFVINSSNVGNGLTSLDTNNNIVGIGTTFLDNVYQAVEVSIAQTTVSGLGVTYVKRVVVSVSSYNSLSGIGFSDFYGEYSWGKISLPSRRKENSYNAYTSNGYVGIKTGTIVKRSSPLKYLNYIP